VIGERSAEEEEEEEGGKRAGRDSKG